MARPGVTYLEVANAAQQIVAAGKYPTIEAIRAALGTGSNSTLSAHLRNWKSQCDHSQSGLNKENIPDELVNALKGVWERAANLADEKIQAIELETQQDLALLNREAEQLQVEYVNSQQQNLQLKQDLNNYAVQNSMLEQAIAEYKIQIAALNEKQNSYQQQLEEKTARISELHKQNQQIQSNLEHYRAAAQEQRQQDQLRSEHQQQLLEQALQQARQELIRVQNESSKSQHELQQMNFAFDAAKQEAVKANLELTNAIDQLNAARIELASTNTELLNIQANYANVQAKLGAQSDLHTVLQTQLAIAEAKISDLKSEADNTSEQYQILLQQNWRLDQEKAELLKRFKEITLET